MWSCKCYHDKERILERNTAKLALIIIYHPTKPEVICPRSFKPIPPNSCSLHPFALR